MPTGQRRLTIALLALPLAAVSPRPTRGDAPSAPQTRPAASAPAEWLDPDERELIRLIEQMGSDKYAQREAAYEKLKALGPAVVPLLKPYQNHRDPEIAQRVKGVMDTFKFMATGAMLLSIPLPPHNVEAIVITRAGGERFRVNYAYHLGLKVGDVLVKVNDMDITGAAALEDVPKPRNNTYYILRQGRLLTLEVEGIINGVNAVDWQADNGGNDIVRGLAAMQDGKYEGAYRRFAAAVDQGFEPPRWPNTTSTTPPPHGSTAPTGRSTPPRAIILNTASFPGHMPTRTT
jgi:hypothetical protein